MSKVLRHGFIAILMSAASSAAIAAPKYNIIDLGMPTGSLQTTANAINASGQVAGDSLSSINNSFATDGVLLSGGTVTKIGGLSGVDRRFTTANAINALGQIAGSASIDGSNYHEHAVLWGAGVMYDLGMLPGGNASYGYGINLNTQITGYTTFDNARNRAFLFSGGQMHNIGTLGDINSASYGMDINDAGAITGWSTVGYTDRAFVYQNGLMGDIGDLGGGSSRGFAINNHGQITGSSKLANGEIHAFLYSNSVMQDIGGLPGCNACGAALNDYGRSVGTCYGENGFKTGFISGAGQIWDLNDMIDPTSGWVITEASGINLDGQISATAIRPGDVGTHGFAVRLDPIAYITGGGGFGGPHFPHFPSAVPEPTSWAMLIAGFGFTGIAMRRRRGSAAVSA